MWLLYPCLLYLVSIRPTFGVPSEHELYEMLMSKYDKRERPVHTSTQKLVVKLGVILQQLIDIDEKNQILMINAWLKYEWRDYNLVWNASEYSGVTDVRFPMGKLWKPDVLLYNSVDSSFDSTYPTNMVLYSDGTINWIPPGIFQTSCKIDITWFPFDEQHCFLKFGSWTYDGTKLDLIPDGDKFDMSEYLVNGEWNLYNSTVERSEKFYECCPEPYPSLKFTLLLKRRTLYYGFNLIIPCILITIMTILGFTLPPDAGEKIGLQITVLLSICFFLGIVSGMVPPTSEAVPLLGTFFSCCMFVVSASVVMTVVVLNFHHRSPDTHEMGDLTRTVLLYWIPWLLCMSRPGQPIGRQDLPNPFKTSDYRAEYEDKLLSGSMTSSMHRSDTDLEYRINQCFKHMAESKSSFDTGQQAQLMMMHRIFCELKFITHRMTSEDEDNEKQNEWKFAAMAIDRLCLVLFSLFIAGSTCYIFFTAPYLTA